MKHLFKYFNTVKKELFFVPILILIEAFFEILIPNYVRKLIDEGLDAPTGYNPALVYKYGLMMIIFAVLALITGVIMTRLAAKVSSQFAKNLREAQFKKIQEYSFENIDNFKTSSLITRITMDVNMVQMAVNMILRVSFRAPSLFLFSIISISLFAPTLVTVFAAVVPILLFGFFIILKNAYQHFVKMFHKIDTLNLTIQEDLIGIRAVKSFVREDHEVERFTQATMDVRQNAVRAEKWVIFNDPLMQFSIGISFVFVGILGSSLMSVNGLTKGEFTNVITYINQILFSLMMISQIFLWFVMSRASVKRINEVLDEKPLITEIANPVTTIKDAKIKFNHVSFKYNPENEKAILKDIDLEIPSGYVVGIFGATGSGKSTLVQLLARLYDVTSGSITIGGVDVRNYHLETLRQEVILVLQKNVLFSGTVLDNLRWGKKDATEEEAVAVLKKAQAYDFVSKMKNGLSSWIEQGGVNVSGGQRQRLTIARALIAQPKILILDDSTSAVDTKTDAKIRQVLAKENPEMTKIIISQRLSSLQDANLILIMGEEGIVAKGNHETLYRENKMYQTIYNTQQNEKEVME